MSIEAHMQAIADKRQRIKQEIETEKQRPMPDFMKITNMKKLNMKLKEEMMLYSIRQKSAASGS